MLKEFYLNGEMTEVEWLLSLQTASSILEEWEPLAHLDGKWDHLICVLEWQEKEGGEDHPEVRHALAQAKRQGLAVEPLSNSYDRNAVLIQGDWAYGRMRMLSASMKQRLPRPKRLKTASRYEGYNLYPVIEDEFDISIQDKNLDWMRRRYPCGCCGGPGPNAAGVRHLPTMITVEVDFFRSYTKNHDFALQLLKSQLRMRKETLAKQGCSESSNPS